MVPIPTFPEASIYIPAFVVPLPNHVTPVALIVPFTSNRYSGVEVPTPNLASNMLM